MQHIKEYKLTKYACYGGGCSMAVVSVLSPLLFVTFRQMYGISYTLLGFLIVMNFSTQLAIDLIFSFFSKYFNIHKTIRTMPVITLVGLLIYGIMPWALPEYTYLWLIIGTIIFSVSSGLGEVLISPVVAAIPSDYPEREMSKLHSAYAWGSVVVVVISTLFLKVCGTHNWRYLVLFLSILPLADAIMFAKAKLPEMPMEQDAKRGVHSFKNKGIFMCCICIFLGGATELTMSEWVSSFTESGLGLPKVVGDILGVAMFSMLLGIGRTVYSKIGKNVSTVMLAGMMGSAVCYIVASLSMNPIIGLAACVITGLCVSMLWPGTLIYTEENLPNPGVAVYALMAAGGDLGASVAPQLVGILSDKIAALNYANTIAMKFNITAEQVGMRAGMLAASIFPLMGVGIIFAMRRYFRKNNNKPTTNSKKLN